MRTGEFTVGYDSGSGRVLVLVTDSDAIEVWAIDGANGVGTARWTQLATTGAEVPALRQSTLVVHDPDRDAMYMLGGLQRPDLTALGDIWMLERASGVDGSPQWRALLQEGMQPEPRGHHSGLLVPAETRCSLRRYDQCRHRVLGRLDARCGTGSRGAPLRRRASDSFGFGHRQLRPRAPHPALPRLSRNPNLPQAPCRFGAVWHLRLDDDVEPLREVVLPEDEDAPFAWVAGPSTAYDAASDRLFLMGTADASENPRKPCACSRTPRQNDARACAAHAPSSSSQRNSPGVHSLRTS